VNPLLIDLIPRNGFTTEDTEVWVRGCYFQDKASTQVKVGDKPVKILEIEDNLIVCQLPARPDLQCETDVVVTVTNTAQQTGQMFESTKKLTFRYVPRLGCGSTSADVPQDWQHTSSTKHPGKEDVQPIQSEFPAIPQEVNPMYGGGIPMESDPFEWTSSHDAFFRVLGTTHKAPGPEELLDLVYSDQGGHNYNPDPFAQRNF